MGGSHAVHPDYALDVDEMILDYLLYNATRTQLAAFRGSLQGDYSSQTATATTTTTTTTTTASSLLQMFDSFLALFRRNHPGYEFSAETEYNMMLLELAALFTHRHDPAALSSETLSRLRDQADVNGALRRAWLARHGGIPIDNDIEERIKGTWSSYTQHPGLDARCPPPPVTATPHIHLPLSALLPHFLSLSAQTAAKIGQIVNQDWMRLAAEFMLLSAWERLVFFRDESVAGTSASSPIKEAFAWGWSPEDGDGLPLPPVVDDEDLGLGRQTGVEEEMCEHEAMINNMFRDDDDPDPRPVEGCPLSAPREIPGWAQVRRDFMALFAPSSADPIVLGEEALERQRQQQQRWQIQRLEAIGDEFPTRVLEEKLADYLEGLWSLERLPILAQIERGSVDGMTHDEFVCFNARVFGSGAGTPNTMVLLL